MLKEQKWVITEIYGVKDSVIEEFYMRNVALKMEVSQADSE